MNPEIGFHGKAVGLEMLHGQRGRGNRPMQWKEHWAGPELGKWRNHQRAIRQKKSLWGALCPDLHLMTAAVLHMIEDRQRKSEALVFRAPKTRPGIK